MLQLFIILLFTWPHLVRKCHRPLHLASQWSLAFSSGWAVPSVQTPVQSHMWTCKHTHTHLIPTCATLMSVLTAGGNSLTICIHVSLFNPSLNHCDGRNPTGGIFNLLAPVNNHPRWLVMISSSLVHANVKCSCSSV